MYSNCSDGHSEAWSPRDFNTCDEVNFKRKIVSIFGHIDRVSRQLAGSMELGPSIVSNYDQNDGQVSAPRISSKLMMTENSSKGNASPYGEAVASHNRYGVVVRLVPALKSCVDGVSPGASDVG